MRTVARTRPQAKGVSKHKKTASVCVLGVSPAAPIPILTGVRIFVLRHVLEEEPRVVETATAGEMKRERLLKTESVREQEQCTAHV